MYTQSANEEHAIRELLQRLGVLPPSCPPLADSLRALKHAWFRYTPEPWRSDGGGFLQICSIEPVELSSLGPIAVRLYIANGPFLRLVSDPSPPGIWIAEAHYARGGFMEVSRGRLARID